MTPTPQHEVMVLEQEQRRRIKWSAGELAQLASAFEATGNLVMSEKLWTMSGALTRSIDILHGTEGLRLDLLVNPQKHSVDSTRERIRNIISEVDYGI